MFDFGDLEDEDPSPDPEELAREAAAQAAAEAEQVAAKLENELWNERRDACKALAALGPAAAPYAEILGRRVARDSDYEVQKAAVVALKAVREAGVQPLQLLSIHNEPSVRELANKALRELEKSGVDIPEAPKPEPTSTKLKLLQEDMQREDDEPGVSVEMERARRPEPARRENLGEATRRENSKQDSATVRQAAAPSAREAPRRAPPVAREEGLHRKGVSVQPPVQSKAESAPVVESQYANPIYHFAWPAVQFEMFNEYLPMRVERDIVTPHELITIWDKEWKVPYANRIKVLAPEEADKRFLHPHDDVVPGPPHVVKLHCGSGSILENLAVALKRYGSMDAQECTARQQVQDQQRAVAAEVRGRDDAREQHRWMKLNEDWERRQNSETEEDRRRRRELQLRSPWRLRDDSTQSTTRGSGAGARPAPGMNYNPYPGRTR